MQPDSPSDSADAPAAPSSAAPSSAARLPWEVCRRGRTSRRASPVRFVRDRILFVCSPPSGFVLGGGGLDEGERGGERRGVGLVF